MQTIPYLQRVRGLVSERNIKYVCVIGAGFISIEIAENLHHLELYISIVEYRPHVFPPLDADTAEILHTV